MQRTYWRQNPRACYEASYQIRVRGHLDPQWADWFCGMTITHEANGDTVLASLVADQAAPHGLLARVRDLGLTLVSVNRMEDKADRRSDDKHARTGGEAMSDTQTSQRRAYWSTAPELPPEVFAAWHKPDGAISPVAVVATVDPDGSPRTAPFGSLRAITPQLLRLCSWHDHDTSANLCRDGRVMVCLISPPDISVSVRGRARVVRQRMDHDETFTALDIDVEEVKNDMAYRIVIESGIEIYAKEKYKPWYDAAMAELEAIG